MVNCLLVMRALKAKTGQNSASIANHVIIHHYGSLFRDTKSLFF